MNRNDIERMAREAKGHAYTNRYTPGETAFAFSIDRLEHFVALVAAAEREECAGLAERRLLDDDNADRRVGHHHACKSIAAAIRARSKHD